jgi:Zn ribbon nucleic-acid-binding protein
MSNGRCPHCGAEVDPEGWEVGAVNGPQCMGCGATAKTLEDWNARRGISEPLDDDFVRI